MDKLPPHHMHLELLTLRLVHILCGTFWVGSGVYTALFLAPALASSGVNAGQVFAALGRRRLFATLPIVALLTMLSGFRLLWIASGGSLGAYAATGSGRAYMWSGFAAVVAFILSLVVSRPASVRIGHLTVAMQTATADRAILERQVAALRRRTSVSSATALTLLALCAAGMSIGRYL
jgi:hypothetical protein